MTQEHPIVFAFWEHPHLINQFLCQGASLLHPSLEKNLWQSKHLWFVRIHKEASQLQSSHLPEGSHHLHLLLVQLPSKHLQKCLVQRTCDRNAWIKKQLSHRCPNYHHVWWRHDELQPPFWFCCQSKHPRSRQHHWDRSLHNEFLRS